MRNKNKVQRAAMGALVAAVLMVGAGQASAALRFPADGPSKLPETRVRLLDDGSSGIGRLRLMLASVRMFPDGPGIQIRRWPARLVPRTN